MLLAVDHGGRCAAALLDVVLQRVHCLAMFHSLLGHACLQTLKSFHDLVLSALGLSFLFVFNILVGDFLRRT